MVSILYSAVFHGVSFCGVPLIVFYCVGVMVLLCVRFAWRPFCSACLLLVVLCF